MTLKDFQEAIRVDKIRRIQASHDEAVASSAIVRLGVVSLGDLYADACAVCGCHGYYGLASVYGPEGCVEAVKNGRVYCELHLPRDSQPNTDSTTKVTY